MFHRRLVELVGRPRVLSRDAHAALGVVQRSVGELGQILILEREDDVNLQAGDERPVELEIPGSPSVLPTRTTVPFST